MSDILYIPHGSDNTCLKSVNPHKTPRFISHMVQIILYRLSRVSRHYACLYIPHGSDNTLLVLAIM